MNMIVHHPKTEADQKELERKAALLHNQAVLRHLKQLSCPNYQKQALIKGINPDKL
jgi:hypothetical protein